MTTSEDERAAFERAGEWHARTHTARAPQPEPVREALKALVDAIEHSREIHRFSTLWDDARAALSTQERPRSAMGDHGEGGYPTERAGEAVQRPAGDDRGAAIISDAADALAWHYENPHPKDATGRRQKQDARLALRLRSLVLPKSSS
jgi:hypothetical protein